MSFGDGALTRQGVRASVERYSLKDLEVFYGFEGEAPLLEASLALRTLAHAVELGRRDAIPEETISTVETYNRDDCVSAMRLRDCLEQVRRGLIDEGKRSVVDRYRFPPQECEIREGDDLRDGEGGAFGEVEAIDVVACYIDIRKGPKIAGEHRSSVFSYTDVRDYVKRDSLMRLGTWVVDRHAMLTP